MVHLYLDRLGAAVMPRPVFFKVCAHRVLAIGEMLHLTPKKFEVIYGRTSVDADPFCVNVFFTVQVP